MQNHSPVFKSLLVSLLSLSLLSCGDSDKTETPPPANVPPVASAGNDQSVDEQSTVTLSGTGTDSDGTISTYSWAQTAGTNVSLSASSAASTTFVAPDLNADETLTFSLTVTDNDGASHSDSVSVNVLRINEDPIANAGPDQSIDEQTTVTLTGTGSDDGTISSYSWSQTAGTSVSLSSITEASIDFIAPDVTATETLLFTLTVTDDEGATNSDTVSIEVRKVNIAPTVNAGNDKNAIVGDTVSLNDASASDADGDTLTYTWALLAPPNSTASLSSTSVLTPDFTPDIAGTYVASLTANDGAATSQSDSVNIVVTEPVINPTTTRVNGTVLAFNTTQQKVAIDSTQVVISINLLDENNNILATSTPEATENPQVGDELRFNSEVTANNAAKVAVDVSYPGYTSSSWRVNYNDVVNLDAKLLQIPVQQVAESSMQSVSGQMTDGFNLQLSDTVNGQQVTTMSISVPSSLLPANTASLSMAVETFDPNDPADAEYFPGEYADSDGNQLVSVAFNFADVTTDSNEPLAAAMQRVRAEKMANLVGTAAKLEEEPVIINRNIPALSCPILETLGDSDASQDGFQVPIYVFNPYSGLWELLGQGTIYDAMGQMVDAGRTQFDCTTSNYTMEILVTSEIFLSKWWNLDYPLLFSQPKELCATVEVQNTEQQVIAGVIGFVSDKDDSFDFSSSFFITDQQGRAEICVTLISETDDTEAELYFYNSTEFGYSQSTINLSEVSDEPEIQIITVDRAKLCYVDGKVTYTDGVPAHKQLMYAIGTNSFSYNFGLTDEEGNYSLAVTCEIEHALYNYTGYLFGAVFSQSDDPNNHIKSVNVDANVDFDESSDDGVSVTTKDFVVPYSPPYFVGYGLTTNNQILVSAYGLYDAFPMTVKINVRNVDDTQQFGEVIGQLTIDPEDDENDFWYLNYSTLTLDFTFPAGADSLYGDVEIIDALGKTWTMNPILLR
ncbi:MAG: hypothetical protein NWQ54_03415 [Paraglaciecola sp.]|nr:hypothetical protein [Paraglaciecola sp.]